MKMLMYAIAVLLFLVGVFYAFNAYIYQQKQGNGSDAPDALMVTRDGVVSEADVIADGSLRITAISKESETFFVQIPSDAVNCSAADNLPVSGNITRGDRIEVRGFVARDGTVVPCESPAHYMLVTGIYQSGKLGMRFPYNKGVDGYVLATTSGREVGDETLVEQVVLTKAAEVDRNQEGEVREGPPTITISVYDNALRQSAAVWATENPELSRATRILGESEEAVVGGANAVRFMADGLYAAVVHVVAHDSYQYVMAGEYADEESSLAGDYRTLIDALNFIPVTE